jgi:hypothetical protein
VKTPVGIPEEDLFFWGPIMADPPMATLAQMQDGTYSIDDVLDMNLILRWKAEQMAKK